MENPDTGTTFVVKIISNGNSRKLFKMMDNTANKLNTYDLWMGLCLPIGISEADAREQYRALYDAYVSPFRHYHNMEHIKSMLFQRQETEAENPDVLDFAIFFHDAVYNPVSKKNEEKSAFMACKFLKDARWPNFKTDALYEMILATKTHQINKDFPDSALMIDLDLAVLGSDSSVYQAYSEGVRHEHFMVPNPIYKKGRIKVLHKFLKKGRIFNTETYYKRYENTARQNMEREIRQLES